MNVDKLFVAVSDLENYCVVMMVSEMSCFDMSPVEHIMMSDFLGPNLFQFRVFPFSPNSLMTMVMDLIEVTVDVDINLYLGICHFF
jgi:hypothetical protein